MVKTVQQNRDALNAFLDRAQKFPHKSSSFSSGGYGDGGDCICCISCGGGSSNDSDAAAAFALIIAATAVIFGGVIGAVYSADKGLNAAKHLRKARRMHQLATGSPADFNTALDLDRSINTSELQGKLQKITKPIKSRELRMVMKHSIYFVACLVMIAASAVLVAAALMHFPVVLMAIGIAALITAGSVSLANWAINERMDNRFQKKLAKIQATIPTVRSDLKSLFSQQWRSLRSA